MIKDSIEKLKKYVAKEFLTTPKGRENLRMIIRKLMENDSTKNMVRRKAKEKYTVNNGGIFNTIKSSAINYQIDKFCDNFSYREELMSNMETFARSEIGKIIIEEAVK